MPETKMSSDRRLNATLESIESARKTLKQSQRTVDRVARQIQRTERVLHRIRDAERSRQKG